MKYSIQRQPRRRPHAHIHTGKRMRCVCALGRKCAASANRKHNAHKKQSLPLHTHAHTHIHTTAAPSIFVSQMTGFHSVEPFLTARAWQRAFVLDIGRRAGVAGCCPAAAGGGGSSLMGAEPSKAMRMAGAYAGAHSYATQATHTHMNAYALRRSIRSHVHCTFSRYCAVHIFHRRIGARRAQGRPATIYRAAFRARARAIRN